MPDITWTPSIPTAQEWQVLATCWGITTDAVARLSQHGWAQATETADTSSPRLVDVAGSGRLTIFPRAGKNTPTYVQRLVGIRGLAVLRAHERREPNDVTTVLHASHEPDLAALVSRCSSDDLAAAEPTLNSELPAIGRYLNHDLIAIAAAVATPAGPPEVSVLVDPAHRRKGHAERCELTLMDIAAEHMRWLQHRTVASDKASQRLAAKCGFRLISTETVLAEAPDDQDRRGQNS